MEMKVSILDYTENGMHKVARMARATRKNEIDGDNIYQEMKDDNFIKNLIKVEHYGILEHINFTFHVSEISRALTHQLVRHRIGFSYLQMSNRHAKPNEDDYIIPPSIKNHKNKNHSCCPDLYKKVEDFYRDVVQDIWNDYERLIESGIPIEDARYVLPPAFFTHISFTCNARSLRHFLELRLAKGAQWEIREMACKIFDIVYDIYPLLFEDLKELRDNA